MRCRAKFVVSSIVLVAAAAVLVVPLPRSSYPASVDALMNLSHVPIFVLVTFAAWLLFRPGVSIAFVCGVLLAFGLEGVQLVTGRTAGITDLLRGVSGCAMAAVLLDAWSKGASRRRRIAAIVLAAGFLAWPLADTVPAILDGYHEYRQFPVICDFQSASQARRWHLRNARLEWVSKAGMGALPEGRFVVETAPSGYADAILCPLRSNWSGYEKFVCEFSFDGEPLSILISIRDGRKVRPLQKRFDLQRVYPAGSHRVEIDLAGLARGDDFAPLDLSRVQTLHFVVEAAQQRRTLRLHRFYLD